MFKKTILQLLKDPNRSLSEDLVDYVVQFSSLKIATWDLLIDERCYSRRERHLICHFVFMKTPVSSVVIFFAHLQLTQETKLTLLLVLMYGSHKS